MPLLLIDQDGPLADFDAAVLGVLDANGYNSSLLVRTEWEISNDVARCFGPDAAHLVDEARHSAGFYRRLPVTAGAKEGITALLEAGCDVVVCSSPNLRNPSCASDKITWIEEHFPELRKSFVLAKDKTLIHGNVLLDDQPAVTGSIIPSWRHVRFATAGNAHLAHDTVLHSWSDWELLLTLASEQDDATRTSNRLVGELLPFMLADVSCALEIGPAPAGHHDDCDDCRWYAAATAWATRVTAGEFTHWGVNQLPS